MSNNQPLVTFCFNAENQLWEQDMWNNQLLNRSLDSRLPQQSQFLPRPEPTVSRQKFTKDQPTTKPLTQPTKNVNIESTLIHGQGTLNKDCISLAEAQNLNSFKLENAQQLYRKFHSPEIDRSGYPDRDKKIFDNTSKEIYNSTDIRNQFSCDPFIRANSK